MILNADKIQYVHPSVSGRFEATLENSEKVIISRQYVGELKLNDAHAVASAKIRGEFADTDQSALSCIQIQALALFQAHTKEMEEKYGETIMEERKILTPQSVQQDLDALGQYKTADVDRLIRRYVKEQADAAPLREHILTEQQFHRIYYYVNLQQICKFTAN